MAYVDTLTMTYSEAYAEMMFGTIVESDHILYKLHEGKLISCSIIGLATWLPVESTKIEHLMFKKFDKSEFKKTPKKKTLQYLVVNNNKGEKRATSCKEMYKLFTEKQPALDHALSIGFSFFLGKPDLDKAGVMNTFATGNIDVMIITLEVE